MLSIAVEMARKRLMETGLATKGEFKGCTEQEILLIEGQFGIQLPICYKDFLSVMGRSAGDFLVGTDYTFPKMLRLREPAESLLERCVPGYSLAKNAFVFVGHQGYNYEWFECQDRTNDPPVYLFTEMEKKPRVVYNSFSQWLLGVVDDEIAGYLRQRR